MLKENNLFIIYKSFHKVEIGDQMKRIQKISLWFAIFSSLNIAFETLLSIPLFSAILPNNTFFSMFYAFLIGLSAFFNMFLTIDD